MKRRASMLASAAFACAFLAPLSAAQVGDIQFPTSGSERAQRQFLRGAAILHSFGFEDAIEAFQEAQRLDPDFALAYWGEAMAHNGNPLSSPTRQDLSAARAALRKLGRTREERVAKAKTHREKMYMEAVELLYGAGDKEARDRAYAFAMSKLVERYPEDQEARAFYALALLGTVRRAGEDFTQQMRGAAVAEEVFRSNPRHPGAAHYIIHAFDDPVHAPLALYAAERYAEIAPDVEHALHMPSHIFVQLGMWEQVMKTNERAYRASSEWATRKGLPDTRRDFHALSWKQYAHLQRGEHEKAWEAVEEIREIAEREETTPRLRATLSNMRARYLIESGDWDAISIPVDTLATERSAGDVYLLLAAGMRATEKKDLAIAETVVARLRELADGDTAELKSYLQGQVTLEDLAVSAGMAHLEVASLLHLARGETDRAVATLEKAIERERDMHPAYGPPEPMVPPMELYGQFLLEAGRPREAASAFSEMLVRMPNRAQSLLGAARAAAALGDSETARARYEELRSVWSASEDTAALSEIERYLGETSQ